MSAYEQETQIVIEGPLVHWGDSDDVFASTLLEAQQTLAAPPAMAGGLPRPSATKRDAWRSALVRWIHGSLLEVMGGMHGSR